MSLIHYFQDSDFVPMIDPETHSSSRLTQNESKIYPSILILQTPDVEEIAKAIWQRQRDAMAPNSIGHNIKWRDESVPARFWEEFLRDAQAVLSLLTKMQREAVTP